MVIFNIKNPYYDDKNDREEAEKKYDSIKISDVDEGEKPVFRYYPRALNAFSESIHDDHYKNRYDDENNEYEEELTFLINTAEQCKRPTDMLKFIGYYFKCSILQSDEVFANKDNKDSDNLTT